MGCQISCGNNSETYAGKERRNTVIIRPKVQLNVGKAINLSDTENAKIIFIFGGPGSGKGTIVNNLLEMFQLKFVCGEDLILQNLRDKLIPNDEKHEGQTNNMATLELAKMLLNNPSVVSLQWVLEMIKEEIKKYSGQSVLIDVMPNLKFLLRVEGFMTSCCKDEMKNFENKHPVALAINLDLDRDHLVSNIQQTHACVRAPSKEQPKNSGGTGDELDTSKTERRFDQYSKSVKNFISYFESCDKLLSVDTSCGDIYSVWESVRDFILQTGLILPVKGVAVVILFAFDDEGDCVDLERYPLREVILKDLVHDANAEPVELLRSLGKYVDSSAGSTRLFLVRLKNTSITKESVDKFKDPEVMFVNVDIGQLDYFIHGIQRKTLRKKSIARKQAQLYKAVCSTDNETLLFPADIDTELCRRIAICLRKGRQL